MKKAVIGLIVAAIVLIAFCFGGEESFPAENYLRMHIRANSDGAEDQAVKYLVRDAIVELLTPVAAECGSKEEALSAIESVLPQAVQTAEETLRNAGFFYGAKAELRREEFPTRVYEGTTLSAGVYDALVVELGAGEGDNWWCVVYPPLCFTGTQNVVYKSKILEIVRKFFD